MCDTLGGIFVDQKTTVVKVIKRKVPEFYPDDFCENVSVLNTILFIVTFLQGVQCCSSNNGWYGWSS